MIMTEYDVKRLALILAVQAEIEGMKIYNLKCNDPGRYLDETAFASKAEELRNLAYTHDLQLFG